MKLRSLLAWTLAVIVVLILVAAALVKLLLGPDRIVAALIPRLEEALQRQVTYGDVEFTLLGGIGVRIHDVQVKNDPGFARENFLRIGHIDCSVNFWPLLRGEVEFGRLALVEPELDLIRSIDGTTNYHLADPSIDVPGDERVLGALPAFDELVIRKGNIVWRNDSTNSKLVIGQVSFRNHLIQSDSSVYDGKLRADSLALATEFEEILFYPAGIAADYRAIYWGDGDSLALRKFEVAASELRGRLEGTIGDFSTSPDVDLRLIAPRIRLDRLSNSPLIAAVEALHDVDFGGEVRVDAGYHGLLSDPRPDKLQGKVTITGFSADSPRLQADLEIELAELNFNAQSVSFFTEKATVGDVPASFRLAVDNFDDPNLSFEVKFSSGVNFLTQVAQLDSRTDISGTVDVALSGFSRWQTREDLRLLGSIRLTDFSYEAPGMRTPIDDVDLDCQFLGKDMRLQQFQLMAGESDLQMNGTVTDFAAYVATWGQAAKRPLFEFESNSDNLNLDLLTQPNVDDAGVSDSLLQLPLLALFPDFDVSGSVFCDRANFGDIVIEALYSRVTMLNRILHLDSINCGIYGGNASGDAIVDLSTPDSVSWELDISAQGIEANSILPRFVGLEDQFFGGGKLLAEFSGQGISESQMSQSLVGSGSFSVADGRLARFDLGRRIERELGFEFISQASIHNLEAAFSVANEQVELSDMQFSTGRSDYTVGGVVDFTSDLDLMAELQISAANARYLDISAELRRQIEKLGGASVRLHIGGSAIDPIVEVNKVSAVGGR
jgi:hypothetical protein